MSQQCVYLFMNGSRCKEMSLYNRKLCPKHFAYKLKEGSSTVHSESYLHNHPTEIVSHLFLGSEKKVCDKVWLKNNNIKTVINATDDPICDSFPSGVKYKMLYMIDRPEQNIVPHLEKIAKEIDNSLRRGEGILIHCHMGISRSASLVWYWLATRKFRGNLNDALEFLELKRWIVNPNSGFKRQIKDYLKRKSQP